MDPVASLVLSLAALLVSVVSTIAAVWAVQQTRIYRPQARWEPVWPSSRLTQAQSRKPMEVRLINHGSSTAYRVKLGVDSVSVTGAGGHPRYEKNEWSVDPGDAIGLVVPLQKATAVWDGTKKGWILTPDDAAPARPTLTITWFEGSSSRQRSQRFRYPE